MIDSIIQKIVKALPKGFRRKEVFTSFMFNELSGETLWKLCPPDTNYIQEKIGLIHWQTVGEFDDDEDVIVLYPNHYERPLPIFIQALDVVGVVGVPILNCETTPASIFFQERLQNL